MSAYGTSTTKPTPGPEAEHRVEATEEPTNAELARDVSAKLDEVEATLVRLDAEWGRAIETAL